MLLQSAFQFSSGTRFTQTGGQGSLCPGILKDSVPFESNSVTQFLKHEDGTTAFLVHDWHRRSECFGLESLRSGECLHRQIFRSNTIFTVTHALGRVPFSCPVNPDSDVEWGGFQQHWTADSFYFPRLILKPRGRFEDCSRLMIGQSGPVKELRLRLQTTIGIQESISEVAPQAENLGDVLLWKAPGLTRMTLNIGGGCNAKISVFDHFGPKMSFRMTPITASRGLYSTPKLTTRTVNFDDVLPRCALGLPLSKPNPGRDLYDHIKLGPFLFGVITALRLARRTVGDNHGWPWRAPGLTGSNLELEEDSYTQIEPHRFQFRSSMQHCMRSVWVLQHSFSAPKNRPTDASPAHSTAQNAFGSVDSCNLRMSINSSLTRLNPVFEDDCCSEIEPNRCQFGSGVRINVTCMLTHLHSLTSKKHAPTGAALAYSTAQNAFGSVPNSYLGWSINFSLTALNPALEDDSCTKIEPRRCPFGSAMPLALRTILSLHDRISTGKYRSTAPASERSETQTLITGMANRHIGWPHNAIGPLLSGHLTEVSSVKILAEATTISALTRQKTGACAPQKQQTPTPTKKEP
jgi:hypothetical protein